MKVINDKESNLAPAAPGCLTRGDIAFTAFNPSWAADLCKQSSSINIAAIEWGISTVVILKAEFRLPGSLVACRVGGGPLPHPNCSFAGPRRSVGTSSNFNNFQASGHYSCTVQHTQGLVLASTVSLRRASHPAATPEPTVIPPRHGPPRHPTTTSNIRSETTTVPTNPRGHSSHSKSIAACNAWPF